MLRCAVPRNVDVSALAGSIADEIAKYPPDVARKLQDPAFGALARINTLTVAAIARECERAMEPIRRLAAEEAQRKQYLETLDQFSPRQDAPGEREEMNAKIATWRRENGVPEGGLRRGVNPATNGARSAHTSRVVADLARRRAQCSGETSGDDAAQPLVPENC